MKNIHLATVTLPDFGMPTTEPSVAANTYLKRLAKLRQIMQMQDLQAVIIYADREHTANLTYLCGYDPRFEEALLIVTQQEIPALLIGNEGMGYAELCPIPVRRILYQPFSLMGQDRSKSETLLQIFNKEGIEINKKQDLRTKYF